MIDLFGDPQGLWIALAEIAILTIAFYVALRLLRGTLAAGLLRGFVFFTALTFVGLMWITQHLQLERIRYILEQFLPGLVIALIILFQPELRRGLMRIGQNPFFGFADAEGRVIDELVKATIRLSKNQIGMLVAIERDVGLGGYVQGGVQIGARVSSELLETIFYPGTVLHDCAVILREGKIAAAGCRFPLTENPNLSKSLGTRHRAGIGLSEESDAIVVIVSEETGRISACHRGELFPDLDRERLEKMLRELCAPGKVVPVPPDADAERGGKS